MAFENLPENWKDRPLDDPAITADVLDLFVFNEDRVKGALVVLVCDGDGRLVQPVVIGDLPASLSRTEKAQTMDNLALMVLNAGADAGGSMLLAVARESGIYVTDNDREWHEALLRACRRSGVRLLGMWIVTAGAIRPMPRLPALGELSA